MAGTRTWDRLQWLIRERPVTAIVVDGRALPSQPEPDALLSGLRQRFPSVGTILVAGPRPDPLQMVRLGRAAITDLILADVDDLELELPRLVARVGARSTVSVVLRRIGMLLPHRERDVVRSALEGAVLGWDAERLAGIAGWTRAHLSVRLAERGLPSTGHLLLWAKLLHAGRWLSEPGRSAESVSRQLGYSSGAAFRRALRNYVGATPTEVCAAGGLPFVLDRFLDECGLGDSLLHDRSVA